MIRRPDYIARARAQPFSSGTRQLMRARLKPQIDGLIMKEKPLARLVESLRNQDSLFRSHTWTPHAQTHTHTHRRRLESRAYVSSLRRGAKGKRSRDLSNKGRIRKRRGRLNARQLNDDISGLAPHRVSESGRLQGPTRAVARIPSAPFHLREWWTDELAISPERNFPASKFPPPTLPHPLGAACI